MRAVLVTLKGVSVVLGKGRTVQVGPYLFIVIIMSRESIF